MNLHIVGLGTTEMRVGRRGTSGFTLAELLLVLGIILTISSLSIPAFRGITEGGSMQVALSKITGALEAARAYAVANNTHTWVAFTDNATEGESEVRMVAVASLSGVDINPGDSSKEFQTPGSEVDMILPIELLRNVRLDGQIPAGNAMLGNAEQLPEADPLERFPDSASGAGGSAFLVMSVPRFGRSVHFMPSGEARLAEAPPEAIEIVVIPERNPGVSSEQDNRQAAVVRISGLTGLPMVYTAR